jgi:hypothetical protein
VDGERLTIRLSLAELREITAFAVACAEPALAIFERDCAGDSRPRDALAEARKFAGGGNRTKGLRTAALAAHRAARDAHAGELAAAAAAARAAGHAAASAYLHPLAKAHQVMHILGSAVHAARAIELAGDDARRVGFDPVERAVDLATPIVVRVLARYPSAPRRGGRAGELLQRLDASVRGKPV